MSSQNMNIQTYERICKKTKIFVLLGESVILVLRLLAQRLFSAYLGILVVQIIVSATINCKTSCHRQTKLYILLNFILIYLLTINFIEEFNHNDQTLQILFKDKYIIDYIKVGYPLEFAFRFMTTLIMWRVYQYSSMKNSQNGQFIEAQETQAQSPRFDRIHVRTNANQNNFDWNLNLSRQGSQNQGNLRNSGVGLSQNISQRDSRLGLRGSQSQSINNNEYQVPLSNNNQPVNRINLIQNNSPLVRFVQNRPQIINPEINNHQHVFQNSINPQNQYHIPLQQHREIYQPIRYQNQ